MSKKLGLENKYRQFIKPTKLGEYKAVMGKTKNITLEPTSKSFVERRMRLSGIKGSKLIKQAASSVLKKSPIGKVISAIGKAVTSKPGMFGAGIGIGANVKDNNKKMGGGMMRYKTGNAVKLSARQKAIAAKAPPMNRIDGKDFAVLKAEKAKGRGQGLQDEKMKPGKIMKANKGVFAKIMKPGRMEGEKSYLKRLKEKGTSAEKKAYGYLKEKSGSRITSRDIQAALKAMGVNVKKPSPEIKATGARMGKMIKADKGVFAEMKKPQTLLRDLPLKKEPLRKTKYNIKDVYKLANKNKTEARPTSEDVKQAAKFLKVKLNPKTR